MTNDISKHYSVKLETKSTAKLNNNYLNFNYGDDITLSISIMDDGSPKNIDNCEVDMIIVNESGINPIIHNFSDGGITVANNVVTIVCKSGYIDMIGVNIAQLIIRNADQNISTQMFVYNTVSTLSSNDVESAIDGINTIHDIYELIDRMNSVLESVCSSTDELEGKVNDADTIVRTLVDKANTEIAGVNSIIEQAKASEDERKAAELLRIQNEDTRVSSENLRVASETTREQNELTRNTSETSRIEAELVRTNSENKRVTTENLRVEAEIKRSENEAGRVSAEQARVLEFETIKGEQESFKESVNEQILNSKTDYFGEEHLTVDKRLNEDFDKLWQFNNESQLLEYSGTNVTASDSYYGLIKDLSIKGRTLQNLITTISEDRVKYISNLIKSNTTYTIILTKVSGSGQINTYGNDTTTTPHGLFLEKEASNGTYIGIRTTGENTNELTIMNITKNSDLILENVMILEGDYTNTPLSELPYVEGIKSIGENEVTEDGKYKVKIKACGRNFFNPSCLKTQNKNIHITIKEEDNICTINYTNGEYGTYVPFYAKQGQTLKIRGKVKGVQNIRIFKYDDNFIGGGIYNHDYFGEETTISNYNLQITETGVYMLRPWIKSHSATLTDFIATLSDDVSFEPYKETVVEYLLDEPLRSLPNGVKDIIDEEGVLTKRIGKVVLDGSESWSLHIFCS